MTVIPEDVLEFWAKAGPEKWWAKDGDFDAAIQKKFGKTHAEATIGNLDEWSKTENGSLALIIVLDQFSRNLYRDSAKAFENDDQCMHVVSRAMGTGQDRRMRDDLAAFCYLPLMHSESLADQDRCISEMVRLGLEEQIKYAIIHRDIIARFGRFPHRNSLLGRRTTSEEQAFLDDGGFSG